MDECIITLSAESDLFDRIEITVLVVPELWNSVPIECGAL